MAFGPSGLGSSDHVRLACRRASRGSSRPATRIGRRLDRSVEEDREDAAMQDLIDTYRSWRDEKVEFGRAVVIRSFGSAPRPEGAVLLGAADGRLAGSVSGGCVEGAAYEEIERARRDGHQRVIRYGISDEQAWDVGLACGGTIDVLIEPAVDGRVVAAATTLGTAVVTPLPHDAPPPEFGPHEPGSGAPPAEPLTVTSDGKLDGSLGARELDERLVDAARDALERGTSRTIELADRALFVEAFPVKPRLV